MKKGYSSMFMWLFIGLIITFGMGYVLSLYPVTMNKLLGGSKALILVVVELAVVIFFSVRLQKMSKTTAMICYVLYSILTGITFGAIFTVYKMSSILTVFLVTAVLFLVLAIIGYNSKKDLMKMSTWLFMGLIGALLASIINIFVGSSALEIVISVIFIIVFLGYIAFDMKNAENIMNSVGEEKGAIYGAFQLYVDFINLFLQLLKLMGKLKDD